ARGQGSGVIVGPGDDAAVLEPSPGTQIVATTDAFVEGRHYQDRWFRPDQVGARLSTANLSDLAAMAARPRWALLSIGARADSSVESLVALQRGAQERLAREGAAIVGGNVTAVVGAEWLSLTLLGEVLAGRAWTRAGARPDDLLAVTGFPGRAGAGWAMTRGLSDDAKLPEQPLLYAWLEPEPRVNLALALSEVRG